MLKQLSAMDASFVYLETPATPMHIGSVAIYDPSTAPGGFVRFKDILRRFEERLPRARSFRQRLVRVPFDLDHPYWIEDPDFDIEYHVRHIALPKPGDWRQLCIQVARLHARPLDLSKPLWEFTVIEGLDNIEGLPPGCFAIVSKVHHCAIDGLSGVEMSAAVHDLEATPPVDETVDDWRPDRMPAVADLLARSYVNSLAQPARILETIGRSLPGLAKLSDHVAKGEISVERTRPAPKTRLNGKVSSHRVWDAVPFRLDEVRAIKSRVPGATINDVMLAVVGGALREYLNEQGELPRETLNAMAPISVRGEGDAGAAGNQVATMTVGLGTQVESALERLRFVHDDTVNSKALTNAVGAKTLADYSKLMPSALAGLGARLYTSAGAANSHAPTYNCVVSNTPGSPVPLYSVGARMVAMYGMGPLFDGTGLMHSIYSYGPTIAISFTSDRAMIPNPENYAAALRRSFDALRSEAEAHAATPTEQHPATAPAVPNGSTGKRTTAGRQPAPRRK